MATLFFLLQISPISFILNEYDEAKAILKPNYIRLGIWSIAKEKVNQTSWYEFEDSLNHVEGRTIILTLHRLAPLHRKGQKEILLQLLSNHASKIHTIEIGNELDLSLEKTINWGGGQVDKFELYASLVHDFCSSISEIDSEIDIALSFSGRCLDSDSLIVKVRRVLASLDETAPNCVRTIDYHHHNRWDLTSKSVEKFKSIRNIINDYESLETAHLIMTENSTWTLDPYRNPNSRLRLNFQSEQKQAVYLFKSTMLALAFDFKIVFCGIYMDRSNFKSRNSPGRFHYNGLLFNKDINYLDGRPRSGPKRSAYIYKLMDELLRGVETFKHERNGPIDIINVDGTKKFICTWIGHGDSSYSLETAAAKVAKFEVPWASDSVRVIDIFNFEKEDLENFSENQLPNSVLPITNGWVEVEMQEVFPYLLEPV